MAAPNEHRIGFARKDGDRAVETGPRGAPRRHYLRRLHRQKQEAMLEPLAKFQERFERSFFRALRELEKLQKTPRQTAAAPPDKEAPTVPAREPQPRAANPRTTSH